MRHLTLTLVAEVEACEYPDSGKVKVLTGPRGRRGLRRMLLAENTVDGHERDSTEPPAREG